MNTSTTSPAQRQPRVAIVCRLDEAARQAASTFVAQLGLEAAAAPPSGSFPARLDGLRHADYAIVMLPAEDLGTSGATRADVLLEIGYLFGVVGVGRLCFVVTGKPAPAAELDGIARHTMDEGGLWRLLLAREMKQAGLDVDLNRAI
jgi:hypothetical protein